MELFAKLLQEATEETKEYRGFKIKYLEDNPKTSKYVASHNGVTINAGSLESIKKMIDVKFKEKQNLKEEDETKEKPKKKKKLDADGNEIEDEEEEDSEDTEKDDDESEEPTEDKEETPEEGEEVADPAADDEEVEGEEKEDGDTDFYDALFGEVDDALEDGDTDITFDDLGTGEGSEDGSEDSEDAPESPLVSDTRDLINSILDALEAEMLADGETVQEDENIDIGLELISKYADKIPEDVLQTIYDEISEYYEMEVDEKQQEDDDYFEEPVDEEVPVEDEEETEVTFESILNLKLR
jgi:hypothetical protein